MSPADRAEALGWARLTSSAGHEGWRTRSGSGDLVAYYHPPKPWRVWVPGSGLHEFATEAEALTVALDARAGGGL